MYKILRGEEEGRLPEDKPRIATLFDTIIPFRLILMELLGASDLSLFVAVIGCELQESERVKFLSPVRDMPEYERWISGRIDEGYGVTLLGIDALLLMERIANPIRFNRKHRGREKITLWLMVTYKTRSVPRVWPDHDCPRIDPNDGGHPLESNIDLRRCYPTPEMDEGVHPRTRWAELTDHGKWVHEHAWACPFREPPGFQGMSWDFFRMRWTWYASSLDNENNITVICTSQHSVTEGPRRATFPQEEWLGTETEPELSSPGSVNSTIVPCLMQPQRVFDRDRAAPAGVKTAYINLHVVPTEVNEVESLGAFAAVDSRVPLAWNEIRLQCNVSHIKSEYQWQTTLIKLDD